MFHVDRSRVYGHRGHSAGYAEGLVKKAEAKKSTDKKNSAKVMRAGLTVGTTLAFGILEGYRQVLNADGTVKTPGIPGVGIATADLITGVGLHLLSFMGYIKSEKTDAMVDSVANGALGFFAATWGTTLGHELKKKASMGAVTGLFLDEGARVPVDADDVYAAQFR